MFIPHILCLQIPLRSALTNTHFGIPQRKFNNIQYLNHLWKLTNLRILRCDWHYPWHGLHPLNHPCRDLSYTTEVDWAASAPHTLSELSPALISASVLAECLRKLPRPCTFTSLTTLHEGGGCLLGCTYSQIQWVIRDISKFLTSLCSLSNLDSVQSGNHRLNPKEKSVKLYYSYNQMDPTFLFSLCESRAQVF